MVSSINCLSALPSAGGMGKTSFYFPKQSDALCVGNECKKWVQCLVETSQWDGYGKCEYMRLGLRKHEHSNTHAFQGNQ
eukprot:690336-Ditylum_brightwellii.AAC.1